MDPLNEKELSSLLRRWKSPEAPSSLRGVVLPRRLSWWRWLMTGTIRIPVPLGVAATNTLADFQPVRQLEPRIIESNDESNELPKK